VYHRVKPGETLSVIGKAYRVPYQRIARANDLDDPGRIYAGQKLLIPGAKRAIERPLVAIGGQSDPRRSRSRVKPPHAPALLWPIEDRPVTSPFGPRNGRFHDGIDIGASVGVEIHAAAAGEVVFAGVLSGYGNILIVRHGSGFSTVYAHNHRHFVGKGQKVRRGERIAAVGRTGRVTGPNLHFEVRYENRARDPMIFLPAAGWSERTDTELAMSR
jgi:murein DD-endopeptidase MepM/ murein hydrolase activator NlpD